MLWLAAAALFLLVWSLLSAAHQRVERALVEARTYDPSLRRRDLDD